MTRRKRQFSPRGTTPPEPLRARIQQIIAERGVREAIRITGLSAAAVLGLAAGARSYSGTIETAQRALAAHGGTTP